MSYTAPNLIMSIWQVLFAVILIVFGFMAKFQWTKMGICAAEDYEVNRSRFSKMILAIILIFCLEAITTFIRIVLM